MSKLADLVNGLLLGSARVSAVEDVGPHFRRVAFEGEADLLQFRPGDKLQIRVADWTFRTYTPFALEDGRMQILAFDHEGGTPASRWLRALRVGDRVALFGPRKSIVLADVDARAALFGDETSIGLALAQRSLGQSSTVFLESIVPAETEAVLARFGLDAAVVQRVDSDAHLQQIATRVQAHDAPLILTGRAKAIQTLRSALGADRRRIAKTKAYWALGRAGLD